VPFKPKNCGGTMELDRFEWKGFNKNKRKTGLKGKYLFALLIIIILLFVISYLYINSPNFSVNSNSQKKVMINSTLSILPARKIAEGKYIMTIGEESTIRFNLESNEGTDIKSSIGVPEGLEYISGFSQRNETILKGEVKKLWAYVRAVKVGRWNITGVVEANNKTSTKSFELCIDVLEDKARERCK